MKSFFSGTAFKIFIFILLITSVGLIAFYGYNEYTYQKIGISVSEGNYELADNYIDKVSPSYKDIRKIKSFIDIIKKLDQDNSNDINRAYSKLEALKGFKNENINFVYNSLVLNLYKKLLVSQFYSDSLPVSLTERETVPLSTTTTEVAIIQPETYEAATEESKTQVNTTVATSITSTKAAEHVTANTTTYTTTAYSTTEYTTTRHTTVQEASSSQINSTGTVFYVESGEVYHITANCRTLANSKNILSGSIPEGRRPCKVCSQ